MSELRECRTCQAAVLNFRRQVYVALTRINSRSAGRASAPSRVGILAALLVAVAASLWGCARSKTRHKPAVLTTKSDLNRYITTALEHRDADVRRGAIKQLAKVRRGHSTVMKTLDLSARMDASDSVRCAAIRALDRRGGSEAAGTMLAILDNPTSESGSRPASGKVRWGAITVLFDLTSQGLLDGDMNGATGRTAVRLVTSDPARDVRLVAARVLAFHPRTETLEALVDALRQEDFGIVYESERALTHLTGETHDHDHRRWADWLASADDPFSGGKASGGNQGHQSGGRWWKFWSRNN